MTRKTGPTFLPIAGGLLAALLLVAATLAPRLTPTAFAAGPTIPSYSLQADVDYDDAIVRVSQTTRFRNQTGQPLDRAIFQVASTYYGAFHLGAARAQGQPVAPLLDGSVLEVPLPGELPPGAAAEIDLDFQLAVPTSPGRLSAGPRALALGNWFPTLAVHRGDWDRHQYVDTGDSFVTEVADFEVRLTTSRPLVVATTGRVLEDDGTSFHLRARGVRDFGLALSPSYVVAEARAGDVVVRAYTADPDRGRRYADTAARFLAWYGRQLGAYPYRTFSLADVDLPASYGGMEYPGLVFLSSALPPASRGSATEALVGHEIAHQWFYSLVGNDQVADPWLDEAFAEYLPYYAYRDTAPDLFDSLFVGRVLANLDESVRAAGGGSVDASVDDFPGDGPYFAVVYRQGARFLDELRRAMGDADFAAALADEVETFADKIASPRAVLDLFQRHTSANLNPLIARYFSYGAFDDPAPAGWRVEAPDGPWRGRADLFVGAEFPVAQVEVWLDHRRLYAGSQNALSLDLDDVEPGEYVLLVRIWDARGAQYERARRVAVAG